MESGFQSIFLCLTVSLQPRTMKFRLQHSNRQKNKMQLTQEVYLKGEGQGNKFQTTFFWPQRFGNIITCIFFFSLSLSLYLYLYLSLPFPFPTFSFCLSLLLSLSLRSGQFRGQKGLCSFKTFLKCPIICFAHEKNNLPHFQNQQYMNS